MAATIVVTMEVVIVISNEMVVLVIDTGCGSYNLAMTVTTPIMVVMMIG